MIHTLKTWPIYFEEVYAGRKTFEIRKNDRYFLEGDTLILQEYVPETKSYTGRELKFKIGFILYSGFGLQEGFCILSLLPVEADLALDLFEMAIQNVGVEN